MKRTLVLSLVLFFASFAAKAMSYDEARQQAWFLTDKMAYELNLSPEQYDRAYEINLDYLMSLYSPADCMGPSWYYRDADLRCILYDWQYNLFRTLDYFFRPVVWERSRWYYPIASRYRYGYYYYDRPVVYVSYRGGRWRDRRPGGPSPYIGLRPRWGGGMRDRYPGYDRPRRPRVDYNGRPGDDRNDRPWRPGDNNRPGNNNGRPGNGNNNGRPGNSGNNNGNNNGNSSGGVFRPGWAGGRPGNSGNIGTTRPGNGTDRPTTGSRPGNSGGTVTRPGWGSGRTTTPSRPTRSESTGRTWQPQGNLGGPRTSQPSRPVTSTPVQRQSRGDMPSRPSGNMGRPSGGQTSAPANRSTRGNIGGPATGRSFGR